MKVIPFEAITGPPLTIDCPALSVVSDNTLTVVNALVMAEFTMAANGPVNPPLNSTLPPATNVIPVARTAASL